MDKRVRIKEFETKLNAHLEDIQRLYQQYNPTGEYLTISFQRDHWQYNNEYWGKDGDFPINSMNNT